MPAIRLALVLAILCAALPAAAEQVLRAVVPAVPETLDPQRALTMVERALSAEVFEGLVALDQHGKPAPGLAESWLIEDGGRRYVFTLRPGLVWSDGKPLTSEDVVAGIKRALDLSTNAPLAALLLSIAHSSEFQFGTVPEGKSLGVAAPDRRRVVVTLEAPASRLLHVLAMPLAAPVRDDAIGAGPFTLAQGALVRNPNYRGHPLPALERVELKAAASLDAANDMIAAEAADVALGFEPQPRLGRASRLAKEEEGEAAYRFIVNMTRAPFNQREVRHALAMSLDREDAIRELKIGDARAGFSVVPARVAKGYEAPQASYAALKQDARDVISMVLLLDVDRTTQIPLRLAVPQGAVHAALAERAQWLWRLLGFRTEIVTRSASEHEAALLAGDFDIALMTGTGRDADPWPFLMPLSRAAGPLNVARYAEVEFDNRFAPADAEIEPEKRFAALRSAEETLTEDQVILPMLTFRPAPLVARRVSGWSPNFTDTHPLRYLSVE